MRQNAKATGGQPHAGARVALQEAMPSGAIGGRPCASLQEPGNMPAKSTADCTVAAHMHSIGGSVTELVSNY